MAFYPFSSIQLDNLARTFREVYPWPWKNYSILT